MSDGIIRLCREHDQELRQLGAHFVCPHGHTCDVDWYIKPAAARVGPSLPLPVIEEPIERMPKEKRMPKTQSHTRGELQPHGTHQRYFQEVKAGGEPPCDACRKAAAAYSKARREARLSASGETKPQKRETKAPKDETRPVKRETKARALVVRAKASRPRAVVAVVVPRTAGADLEGKVLRLRADLAEAEQAYLAHVQKFLPGLVLSR